MGREVTGVRIEQNKSPYAKVKPKVSADSNQESNTKTPEGNIELKDCEVKQCTSEVPRAENSCDKQEVLAINFDIEKLDIKSPIAEDRKMSSPDKASAGTAAAENLKLNTPQKPTNVRIDKQVWESPRAAETPVSPSLSNPKSPSSSRKSQPTTPFVAKMPFADDEDNWSVASSARTTRSRTTVAVAPTFTCNDRLEKRKEYYAKLEEKRKALEAEKKEYEARTKEDEEAAVKQLRKNMMYRANPVPNFYYEKPPPKKELKKIPTTRAVSPKFGRRKSCSDAINSQSEDKTNVRASRRSLGSLRESSSPNSSSLKKGPLVKSRLKQVKESTKNTPTKITEKSNPDIAVHS